MVQDPHLSLSQRMMRLLVFSLLSLNQLFPSKMYTFSRIQLISLSNLGHCHFFLRQVICCGPFLLLVLPFGNTTKTHCAHYTLFVHPYYVTLPFIQARPLSHQLNLLRYVYTFSIVYSAFAISSSLGPSRCMETATRAAAWAFAHRVFITLAKQGQTNHVFV